MSDPSCTNRGCPYGNYHIDGSLCQPCKGDADRIERDRLRVENKRLRFACQRVVYESTHMHTTKTHLAAIAGEAIGQPIYSNRKVAEGGGQ